jgi:NifU-like protein
MAIYPDAIADSLERLKHTGEGVGSADSGRAVNFDCGGFVEIFIDVAEGSGTVDSARFRSNGCGFMVAAADSVCGKLTAASLSELHGLERFESELIERLGRASDSRSNCFGSVIDAAKAAFQNHRRRMVEEFAGEKALVCPCFGISEDTILKFINTTHPTSVQDVSDACRAGSGCGSCRMVIQELIDTAERERMMTET